MNNEREQLERMIARDEEIVEKVNKRLEANRDRLRKLGERIDGL